MSSQETHEYIEIPLDVEGPGPKETQEYIEVPLKTAPGPKETQEYIEVPLKTAPGTKEIHESIEVVFNRNPPVKTSQTYVEVVVLTGFIPEDVAAADAWFEKPSAIGMGRGLTGDPNDNPANIEDVSRSPKCGSYVLFESQHAGSSWARVYKVTKLANGWRPDDDPTILVPLKNGYAWSKDGRFLAVASSRYHLPTTPMLAFYRTDTWELFAGPLDLEDPYAPAWNWATTRFAVGGYIANERIFNIYSVPGWNVIVTLPDGGGGEFSKDGTMFAYMSWEDNEVLIYETTTWTVIETLVLDYPATSVSWHPAGTHLAATYAKTGVNHYGSTVEIGDWIFWDTSDWSVMPGVPSFVGSTGYGGLGGGPSATRLVRFSGNGKEVSGGQSRGFFNGARAIIYSFPNFVFQHSESGGEGSASKNTFDFSYNGGLWTVADGSLDFPSHVSSVRDGGTLYGSIALGNRGGRVLYGPGQSCADEGWGTVWM